MKILTLATALSLSAVSLSALSLSALPAWADIVTRAQSAHETITSLHDGLNAWLDYGAASQHMDAVFVSYGLDWARQYSGPWGGWTYLDWSYARPVFSHAGDRVHQWQRAVIEGRATEAEAEAAIATGLQRLRAVAQALDIAFHEEFRRSALRGLYSERGHDLTEARNWQLTEADRRVLARYQAMAEALTHPDLGPWVSRIGRLQVMPAPPGVTDPRTDVDALLAEAFADPARLADSALRDALLALDVNSVPEQAEARDLLHEIAALDRLERDHPIVPLLHDAEAMPDGLERDALLRDAARGIAERYGHLAPYLAAGANAGSTEDRIDTARRLLAAAQQVGQLHDDATALGEPPNLLLRIVNGLKAGASLLDGQGGAIDDSRQAARAISDLAEAMPTPVSVTAPFQVPLGIVSGQLNNTRRAWDYASEALQGVTDAMGGDPDGLRRAQAASEALQRTLTPRQVLSDMVDGALDGLANNVPFARSVVDWLRG